MNRFLTSYVLVQFTPATTLTLSKCHARSKRRHRVLAEPRPGLPDARTGRYSTGMRRLLVLITLLLAVSASADDKKMGPILLARPNQTVEIKGLKVPAPVQKCENFGWAAGVELMLRMQGVDLDQKYWIT